MCTPARTVATACALAAQTLTTYQKDKGFLQGFENVRASAWLAQLARWRAKPGHLLKTLHFLEGSENVRASARCANLARWRTNPCPPTQSFLRFRSVSKCARQRARLAQVVRWRANPNHVYQKKSEVFCRLPKMCAPACTVGTGGSLARKPRPKV